MAGHVFVTMGDMTQLACDAWLLPTDHDFSVTGSWSRHVDLVDGRVGGQTAWGADERVRRLTRSNRRSPQIWLGRVGASDRDAAWYVDGALAFVRAVRAALPTDDRTRPPLVAISHVGTGEGGAHESKGEVLDALFRGLIEQLESLDIDVVVVSWDARAHAAAQRARMHALGGEGDGALERAAATWRFGDGTRTETLLGKARDLAVHASAGRLSVFMGSGVSAGAGLPDWTGLLAALGDEVIPPLGADELARVSDPRDQAALLSRRFGSDSVLLERLVSVLSSQNCSLQHALLSSLPVSEYVTTNFDELFEAAAQTNGRSLKVLPIGPDTVPSDSMRWLLKLHGTLSEPNSIVLTRAAYLDAPRQRGALFGMVQAMLMTRHMLFVGYGLRDEDFHLLVHDVRAARRAEQRSRFGTALTLFDDDLQSEIWKDDLDTMAVAPVPDVLDADTVGLAAREVERFLDLVGLLAADRWAFLLDPQYRGMLDPSEIALAEVLDRVALDVEPDDSRDGWMQVADLLRRFGRGATSGEEQEDLPLVRLRDNRTIGDLVPGMEEWVGDPTTEVGVVLNRLLPPEPTWADLARIEVDRVLLERGMGQRRLDNLVEHLRERTTKAASSPSRPPFADAVEAAEAVLSSFDERELVVLERLLDVSGSPRTLAEIGDNFGITRERVRQIEVKVRSRLLDLISRPEMEVLQRRADDIREQIGVVAPLDRIPPELQPDPSSLVDELFAYVAGPYRRSGDWLTSRAHGGPSEVLDAGFVSCQHHGVADLDAMSDALGSLGVDPGLLDALLSSTKRYRRLGESVLLWSGSMSERAARVLRSVGSPMAFDDLVDAVGPEHVKSFANALFASPALVRVGVRSWALVEWDLAKYEGIVPLMCDRLKDGARPVIELAQELNEEFGVSPASISIHATTNPVFVTQGGLVRIRTVLEPYEPSTSLEDAGCIQVGTSWALPVPVDHDMLRGSGRAVPEAVAVAVGLQPLTQISADSAFGAFKMSWRHRPVIGSLRRVAERLGATEGDQLLLIIEGREKLAFQLVTD